MSRIARTLLAVGLCLLAPAALAGGGGAPVTRTYTNPVLNENVPDPFVLKVGSTYYAYVTNGGGNDVPTYKSSDLVHWSFVGNALAGQPKWGRAGLTWAPEVMQFAPNKFVLYYTTRDTLSDRQCIGAAVSTSPTGPFTDSSERPIVCQADIGGSIDASPFQDKDGQRYLLWKNDGNCCNMQTAIFIQKLSADGQKLTGEPSKLIVNDQLWEGAVVEAPTLHHQDGYYYLLYSGATYDNEFYAVGYAVAKSLLGPYKKADDPFLVTEGKVVGPGHQSLVKDGAGKTWLVYHAWTEGAVGDQSGGSRSMRIDPVSFKDGKVNFKGVTLTPQAAPTP